MELRALLTYARPYRGLLMLVAALMLINSGITLFVPWLVARLASDVQMQGNARLELLATILAVLALITGLRFVVSWLSGGVALRLLSDLRVQVFDHLQHLPLSYHQDHRQGDTLALMTYEVARLSNFLSGTLVSAVPLSLTALGAIVLMFRIDPLLAALVPILVPGFYLILKIVGRRLRGLAQDVQMAEADVVALAEESLEMLPAIKSFAREKVEADRYLGQVDRAMGLRLRENRIYAAMDPVIGFTAGAAAVILVFLSSQRLQTGQLDTAELIRFLLYAALLTRPVAELSNLYGQVQSARGTLARMRAVMGRSPAGQGRHFRSRRQ
ncbi:ABC transporter transmembrane domain-containing protein [Alisedimentitalea sp. MJ-SS2]|uniref:ABC transporter transmembrane domain-containing protein n=1 Tax=Aliisedimentitalea sp. MJ-SS2 TaxID=3049795 RepID=UPI00290AE81C|nr:ABC transporter transmembrane domain-containing protein [Alisedimentitalea sp. MJ-SS2]MDU8927359.1 ABC transporter transmembrane domain-containing protein [Alisedimentitalea sp. MJ-SS2]